MGIIHHTLLSTLGNIHRKIDTSLHQEPQKLNIPLINSNLRNTSKLAYPLQSNR